MLSIFCCSSKTPYRSMPLDHDPKFKNFLRWAETIDFVQLCADEDLSAVESATYAVQLVKQVNYGPQESIRYFVPSDDSSFAEVAEEHLIKFNFEKLNSYKNFRCDIHNKFFEINLYQQNPTNSHHWRYNLSRPSRDIDLVYRQGKSADPGKVKVEPSTSQQPSSTDCLGAAGPSNIPCSVLPTQV
ncbi:hypothetical protein LY76DRAFT_671431 [Colletotrichum caudatum]|nr:hypothetical protein LY76DRAFT_671431 [Colletotrichum caudatum]